MNAQARAELLLRDPAAARRRQVRRSLLVGVIFALGVGLRLVPYFAQPGLWHDEAGLALNIEERSYGQLLEPLGYGQAAPPAFMMLTKLAADLLGNDGPLVLRLVPLLCGILAMPLFWWLGRRVLHPRAAMLGLLQVAICDPLLYYSSELKPYSSDAALALVLYLAVLDVGRTRRWSAWRVLGVGLLGGAAVWFSFPAIFILAGIGATWLIAVLMRRSWRSWRQMAPMAAVLLIWAASTLACYLIVLRGASQSQFLQRYWSGDQRYVGAPAGSAFMPLPPRSLGDARWFLDNAFAIFQSPCGFQLTGVAALCAVVGWLRLWHRRRELALMLLLPILAALLASGLRKYPFNGRLLLFIVPGMLLCIAAGAHLILRDTWTIRRVRIVGVMVLALLLLHPVVEAAYHLAHPRRKVQVIAAMRYVQAHRQASDLVYVDAPAELAFRYHAPRMGLSIDPEQQIIGPWRRAGQWPQAQDLDPLRVRVRAGQRIWLVFARDDLTVAQPRTLRPATGSSDPSSAAPDPLGPRLDTYIGHGVTACLHELR